MIGTAIAPTRVNHMVAGARTFSLEDTFLPAHVLNPPPTRHALLAFLLALTAVLHVGTAAWGDLYDGVEGQIAGGAREMVASHQWLVPTNNGVPQLGTPPLTYWAVALSFKVFGVSPTAARLPIALAMIATVALTFLIGERLADYWRGFAAGLIYLCSAGTFALGRLVAPHNVCSVFVAAAVYCAVCGYQRQKFRSVWFTGFWLAAAFATLAQGPAPFLLLSGAVFLASLLFREARLRFARLLHWINPLLFLAIVAPWFVWAHQHFPAFASESVGNPPDSARWRFLLLLPAWSFPAFTLILPALLLTPKKIFRPNELAFADVLPLCWLAAGWSTGLLFGGGRATASLMAAPGFALLAACAWERAPRTLRAAGVALTFVVGTLIASAAWSRFPLLHAILARSVNDATWLSFRPLVQITIASLVVSALAAFLVVRQRGEVMLVLALAAMVPAGLCLIESGSRAAPFLSLADAARYLNPRLGRSGEVVFEAPLRSGNSLSFYLEKRFYVLSEKPAPVEGDATAQARYLDEHFLLEAWARSDPIYLIVDESRVAYWRQLIAQRVHIYHQVTTCGRRVVLSNQL
jgi:4-amino-4-deoxy-L-arabinose transferase-like glycosyltransferase